MRPDQPQVHPVLHLRPVAADAPLDRAPAAEPRQRDRLEVCRLYADGRSAADKGVRARAASGALWRGGVLGADEESCLRVAEETARDAESHGTVLFSEKIKKGGSSRNALQPAAAAALAAAAAADDEDDEDDEAAAAERRSSRHAPSPARAIRSPSSACGRRARCSPASAPRRASAPSTRAASPCDC